MRLDWWGDNILVMPADWLPFPCSAYITQIAPRGAALFANYDMAKRSSVHLIDCPMDGLFGQSVHPAAFYSRNRPAQ